MIENVFASQFEIEKLTTSNNINIWGSKNHNLPIIDLIITFKNCGYAHDDRNEQGISIILQEIINNGLFTNNYQLYLDELYNKNIIINAEVNEDSFTIKIRSTKDKIDQALSLFKQATSFNMNIGRNELQYLKSIITKQKIQNQFDLESTILNELKNNIYPDHPYQNNKYFYIKDINIFNNEKILHKYKNIFTRNNLLISIVGDYDNNIKQLIDKNLNHLYFRKNHNTFNNIHLTNYNTNKLARYTSTHNVLTLGIIGLKPNDLQHYKQLLLINNFNIIHMHVTNSDLQQKFAFLNEIKCKEHNLYYSSLLFCYMPTFNLKQSKDDLVNIIHNFDYYLTESIIETSKKNLIERLNNIYKLNNLEKVEIINWMQFFSLSENYFSDIVQKIETSKAAETRTYIKNIINPKKINFTELE